MHCFIVRELRDKSGDEPASERSAGGLANLIRRARLSVCECVRVRARVCRKGQQFAKHRIIFAARTQRRSSAAAAPKIKFIIMFMQIAKFAWQYS
jgi:hypothetical protein